MLNASKFMSPVSFGIHVSGDETLQLPVHLFKVRLDLKIVYLPSPDPGFALPLFDKDLLTRKRTLTRNYHYNR